MKKKKQFNFAGKISSNAAARKKGFGYGHLLPNGLDVWSPEVDSKVVMDILPYLVKDKNHPDKDKDKGVAVEGSYWFKRPFKFHRNIGAKNSSEICLQSFGKKCPICEYRDKLKKDDSADEDTIKGLKPSERNLYAVVITKINGKKQERKLQLFEFSDYLFQEKFVEQLEDKPEFETFPNPYEGTSISVKFAETNLGGNKFAEPTRFDFEARTKQYDDDFIDEIPCLDECLRVLTYDELKAKFMESDDIETEEEEEEEEKPVKKGKKPVSKPEPEEEDEEEEDDEEEEEEEEEDDEEEDDDEEEEEEPTPRKRKTAVENKKKPEIKKGKKELSCPHNYRFGKGTNKYDECEDCEVWNECYAAKKQSLKK